MAALLGALLLSPFLIILSWMYWLWPKSHARGPGRLGYDLTVLGLAWGLALVAGVIGFHDAAAGGHGPIWKQVVGALAVYHVFPLLLAIGWVLRPRIVGRAQASESSN